MKVLGRKRGKKAEKHVLGQSRKFLPVKKNFKATLDIASPSFVGEWGGVKSQPPPKTAEKDGSPIRL